MAALERHIAIFSDGTSKDGEHDNPERYTNVYRALCCISNRQDDPQPELKALYQHGIGSRGWWIQNRYDGIMGAGTFP